MPRGTRSLAFILIAAVVGACSDSVPPTAPTALDRVSDLEVVSSDVGSSVRWNRKAIALFRARGGSVGRSNAYLSLAQYRAVLAARNWNGGGPQPSLGGAAAGASVVVLQKLYPLDSAIIDAELAAQRAEAPVERQEHFAKGEAIGRQIGAEILALAASDNFGVTDPGAPPTGPGYWTSSGLPIVRGGYGARPFFLTSGKEVILPPPPAFGSPEYLAALEEVRTISQNRTAEQIAIAQKWIPFSGVVFNEVAGELIVKHRRKELEAARIFAYGNTAAFDAIIACFENKFIYWFIRPSQADPLNITTPLGLPNHPSYPSAHSCESGAWVAILTKAFPSERAMLTAMRQEAADSRVYAGLHYVFDNEAGIALGNEVAQIALAREGLNRFGQ